MSNDQPDYFSYLLRVWREKGPGRSTWRASLERSSTREQQAFASLSQLFEFLQEQTGAVFDVGEDESDTKL